AGRPGRVRAGRVRVADPGDCYTRGAAPARTIRRRHRRILGAGRRAGPARLPRARLARHLPGLCVDRVAVLDAPGLRPGSEAARFGALIREDALQRPQLEGVAIETRVIAPGAGRAQRHAPRAPQVRIGDRRVVRAQHSLEVTQVAAYRIG